MYHQYGSKEHFPICLYGSALNTANDIVFDIQHFQNDISCSQAGVSVFNATIPWRFSAPFIIKV